MGRSKGFTLIELLVVLAVLAVVAGAVVVAIDPLGQINRAKDGQIKNDIGQVATALQSYYTFYGSYPSQLSDLVGSGDIKVVPSPPTDCGSSFGTNYGYIKSTCQDDPSLYCTVLVVCKLNSPKLSGAFWCWRSDGGVAFEKGNYLCK